MMPSCDVVMYHYVRSELTGAGIFGMTPTEFEAQVADIADRFEIVDPRDLFACLEDEGGALPERCCLLTFDDGLADHVGNVQPILDDVGVKGLFFVSTGPLTDRKITATHKAHLLGQALGPDGLIDCVVDTLPMEWAGRLEADLAEAERSATNGRGDVGALYRWDCPRQGVFKAWLAYKLPCDVAEDALNSVFEKVLGDEAAVVATFYASADQLRALAAAGHTIGSHGHMHRCYSLMPADEQESDIRRSHDLLTELIGSPPQVFSYPFGKAGSFDDSTRMALRANGFRLAFTSIPGRARFDQDRFGVNRWDCKDSIA